ncbi:MAG TPA: DNA-directed RNA polymerase subunit alpha C-terminal domain-containing protein, partial [Polyangiaceae bacterium]|nr:DNA-directed RNA polymerase subunit alpha C-terminal domain-containing protein [Polyangiaceae bacterium]
MTEKMWFSGGGQRVREAVRSALDWCELCIVVTDGSRATPEDAFWSQLGAEAAKVRQLLLTGGSLPEPWLRTRFDGPGQLRSLEGPIRGHFIWFERGGEVRFLLAPDQLCLSTVTAGGLWMHWEGSGSALPDGLGELFAECCTASREVERATQPRPSPRTDEAQQETQPSDDSRAAPEPYSRAIPSVREVLGIRSTLDFSDLDEEAQALALWSTLIGEGAVDLEQAIRLSAERLRAQGFLEYQLLRQDGRIYGLLESRLLAARRSAYLFDRPQNGLVRAIQPNLDELTAEQWRDCVLGALPIHTRVDREHAVRIGFTYAQLVYGIDAQRLRSGGRADQALRSAINSAIRQGHLERDGAAYLIRSSETSAPTQRGALAPAAESAPPPSAPASKVEASQAAASPPSPSVSQSDAERASRVVATDPAQGGLGGGMPRGAEPGPSEWVSDHPPSSRASTRNVTPSSALDTKLLDLKLPTRAQNWAERQGIDTLRGLVAWDPEAFVKERNVGRRTVQETRELLEARLGCSWESAHSALRQGLEPEPGSSPENEDVDAATEALTSGGASGWAELARRLTSEQRANSLREIDLPARMRTFVEQEELTTLGELFRFRYEELRSRPNLGRKTLNDTLDAVRESLNEQAAPPQYTSFLQSWQAQLLALEPIPRMIVTRRAGMYGTRETLEDVGAMLGVTRERVRQIEAHVVDRLRERSPWTRVVAQKLAEAFGAARALPVALLAQDLWWAGIGEQPLLLEFVIRRVFEDQYFLLEVPNGKLYLTRFPPSVFMEHVESAKARLGKLEYPVELAVVQQILQSETDALDPVLFSEFETLAAEWVLRDSSRPDFALGYG